MRQQRCADSGGGCSGDSGGGGDGSGDSGGGGDGSGDSGGGGDGDEDDGRVTQVWGLSAHVGFGRRDTAAPRLADDDAMDAYLQGNAKICLYTCLYRMLLQHMYGTCACHMYVWHWT